MSSEDIKKQSIAIVDDEEISAKIFTKKLQKLNIDVNHYSSGETFLKNINEKKYDLVLLDILMPTISGMIVLKKIREMYSSVELPVIMLTGKSEVSDVVDALKSGANDYITKSVNLEISIARITTQLKLSSYHNDSLKKKELEILSAMIATYNHEINNPLAIALGYLGDDASQMNDEKLERCKAALLRIAAIVKSIHKLSGEGATYTNYMGSLKMVKVK